MGGTSPEASTESPEASVQGLGGNNPELQRHKKTEMIELFNSYHSPKKLACGKIFTSAKSPEASVQGLGGTNPEAWKTLIG